ncbi:MAG: ribosome biogenesis GTPase Der [Buchnera aphidicola (Periphyllus lyropictus)]|uniref:ribosome biogenesis GTPase Der n=1 Tax=Buchnera aphidicola TaxID=9 RepID=UPI001ECB1CAC|nr:ribosome biogenesis GTPase Der [Buchnera aphidicola]NIH16806.1 ribosome biogenesis GTPase Der [Buchnera aphidicola (Periphyllus lyropictus)]USS94702.1 ribosome biogenesis GTPase Der [Buchnera aphidicola (Periphyllus lyropictus)]
MNLIISLIGCENVGKSTLFNNLIKKKQSLTSKKFKSITRDRQISTFVLDNFIIDIIDTAGFFNSNLDFRDKILFQNNLAIKNSDIIFFIVNAKIGLTYEDQEICNLLRRSKKKVILIINKFDSKSKNLFLIDDFYRLGFKKVFKISALNLNDIEIFKKKLIIYLKNIFKLKYYSKSKNLSLYSNNNIINISIIGKPNVGKSTLINKLANDKNRVITSKISGTTGDSVLVSVYYNNQKYNIFDTSGIRKKSKIKSSLEKIFIKKSISTIKKSNLSILVIDASEKIISKQNLILFNLINKIGRSVIFLVNKWDLLTKSEKSDFKKLFFFRFRFMKNLSVLFISFLFENNLRKLIFKLINKMYFLTKKRFNSAFLTKILKKAVLKQKPPFLGNKSRSKLKFAHSGGINPPIIVIHGNKLNNLSRSYKKYLINFFSLELNLFGFPIFLEFKNSNNPYIYKNK